ncbi:MAG TPA: TetR/AcrR family transcriptional regulator [Anaeromyxobacteraceae bacterium]|nr:TetR/AcrR family transcriptional regulator [Anaeromyxobacteraceae bacterium]
MARAPILNLGKRRQILDAARSLFLAAGYERTAVDAIAARAGVSKATLYSHFADKQALFLACASEESAGMRARLADLLGAPTGEPAADLAEVGQAFLRSVARPSTLAFRRILVAEAGRFPELGRTFFEDATFAVRGRLADYLRRQGEAGSLTVNDGELAAAQFIALCVSDLLWRLELSVLSRVSSDLIHRTVRDALGTFLRAYRPDGLARP